MIEAVIAAAVTVLAFVAPVSWCVALLVRRHRLGAAGREEPVVDAIDPHDVADLDARFADIECEDALRRDTMLASRLQPLVCRAVPLRCIEPVPCMRTARIRFADGTALVAHGAVPGDIGVLAAALRHHAVRPASWSTGATGTRLVLGWCGDRRRLAVVVTGLDQPD